MSESKQPRVGVGVFVRNGDQLLFGKRKGAHGVGTWSLPGGHLEFGESIEDCARREVLEEAGLTLGAVSLGPYTNDIMHDEDKHYITLFVLGEYDGGEPEICEPLKLEEWRWVHWNDLPQPLFIPIENLLKANYNPFNDHG